MFISNKYTRWYYSIISNAQSQGRKKLKPTNINYIYYENHHIIPKCFGGDNNKDNLVLLTAKEHFIVHILLPKMCISIRHQQQMINALHQMNRKCPNHENHYFNSNLYEHYKKKIVCTSEKREKHKNKVSCRDIRTGDFLQVSKKQFQESEHLVGVNHGKKWSKDWCNNHSKMMKENNPFFGKKHSNDTKKNIGEKNSKNMLGRIWITDGSNTLRIKSTDIIPIGYRRGRI